MRAFVTGASGFVGTRLMRRLADEGWEAVGRDQELDVADRSAVAALLGEVRPDAIVHLAAQSSVPGSRDDPAGCFRTNVIGTQSLLAAAAAVVPEARILLVGSGDSYGAAPPDAPPYSEQAPLRPASPYAFSKWATEQLGNHAARAGQDVVRVRPFNHTGAGQSDKFVASSFARQVAEIAAGQRAPRLEVGNLDSVRDFLDVGDVIDAYLQLLDPAVPAAIYNIASGTGVAIREILERLLSQAGVEAEVGVAAERWRPTDALVGNAARLRAATGWAPRIAFAQTLSGLLAWWGDRVSSNAAS